jgi:hypothetical protein
MRYSIVLLIALLIAGCQGRNEIIVPVRTTVPGAVILGPGQSVDLTEFGLIATFDSVTADSRCPLGAECFWEGDGATRFTLHRYQGDAVICTLHTTLSPNFISVNGLNIELTDLLPHRSLGTIVVPGGYAAVLHLDPVYVNK